MPQSLLRVWLAPVAWERWRELLAGELSGEVQLARVLPGEGPAGNEGAVLVLDAADLTGPGREALLELAVRLRPGRPVVVGGVGQLETLLDALNVWQALRVVPVPPPLGTLGEAVRQAHRAVWLQQAVLRGALELRGECQRLTATVDEILNARRKLLHAERLATVARITGALVERVSEQQRLMGAFGAAVAAHARDPALQTMVADAIDGTESLHALLSDMLALSEERDGELDSAEGDLDEITTRAAQLFRLDPRIKRRDLVLDCRSGVRVLLDRHRMLHVLVNLMRNALEATQPGERIVLRTGREGGMGVIEVEDGGTGMPEDVQARVFSPFFTTKGSDGMGLGLSMCRGSVERQRGTLTFRSKSGEGTCFRITLPLA